MARLSFLIHLALALLASNIVYGTVNNVPLPTVNLTEWWGPGNGMTEDEDTTIYDFTIEFNDTVISKLISRWANRRPLVPPLEGTFYDYGFNSDALTLWMNYLVDEYPFDEREDYLNQFSHFKTYIQGLNMHFMRVTSNLTGVELTPLIMLHGWPGSMREFYEAIPYLLSKAEEQGIALDIIVPSLPGYIYSDAAVRPGLGVDKAAVIMRNLMHRLGYSKFFLQGGDMGGLVSGCMATLFADEVLGYHTNFPLVHSPEMIFRLLWGNFHKEEIAESALLSRIYPSVDKFTYYIGRTGYLHIQSTKPDAYGIGLSDTPSGLMSHMLITTGVPNNTGTVDPVPLLDNYVLYYITNSAPTAIRLYAETFNKRYVGLRINEVRTPVPTWVLQAPNELIYLPDALLKLKFTNLLNVTLPATGGHFFAWSMPEEFADDVVTAIVAFKEWHVMNSTMYDSCTSYITE